MICGKFTWNWPSGFGGEDFKLALVNLFSPFRYLPLKKWLALHLNTLEFPSPNDALCQVWLKLAQWFWRRRTKSEFWSSSPEPLGQFQQNFKHPCVKGIQVCSNEGRTDGWTLDANRSERFSSGELKSWFQGNYLTGTDNDHDGAISEIYCFN